MVSISDICDTPAVCEVVVPLCAAADAAPAEFTVAFCASTWLVIWSQLSAASAGMAVAVAAPAAGLLVAAGVAAAPAPASGVVAQAPSRRQTEAAKDTRNKS